MYAIPIAIFIINNLIICTINYKNYGVFELNQYWSKEFKEAYGAITRVIPKEEYSKVPVSQETIKRIYDVSPKFKELEDYLSGEEAIKWSKCGDGKTANQYYKELADEINNAIDEGKIEGYKNKRVTNVPRFNFEDIEKTLKKCKGTIKLQTRFYLVNLTVRNTVNSNVEENKKWESLTLESIDSKSAYNETINTKN